MTFAADDAPAKLLALVGRNKTVLEVGCSSGSQTRVLASELGCKVTAIGAGWRCREKRGTVLHDASRGRFRVA